MEQNAYLIVKCSMAIIQPIIAIWFFDNMLEDNERNSILIKFIIFLILSFYFMFNIYQNKMSIFYCYFFLIIYVNLFKKKEDFFNLFRVIQYMTDGISINVVIFMLFSQITTGNMVELNRGNGIFKIISIFVICTLQIIVFKGHLREKVLIESFTANRIATFSGALIIIQIMLILIIKDFEHNPIITRDKFILVCLLFVISMFFYRVLNFIAKDADEKYNLKMQVKENEFQEKYINEVSRIYRDIQEWKHDYRNNLNVICNLAAEKRLEEMTEYIMEVDSEIIVSESLIYTGIFIIDSIITVKYIYAKDNGIKMNVIAAKITNIHISNYDLNIILSNLLDNAIEAAMKVKKGEISVVIREKHNKIIIHILNNTDGNIQVNNGKYISSKKRTVSWYWINESKRNNK